MRLLDLRYIARTFNSHRLLDQVILFLRLKLKLLERRLQLFRQGRQRDRIDYSAFVILLRLDGIKVHRVSIESYGRSFALLTIVLHLFVFFLDHLLYLLKSSALVDHRVVGQLLRVGFAEAVLLAEAPACNRWQRLRVCVGQ